MGGGRAHNRISPEPPARGCQPKQLADSTGTRHRLETSRAFVVLRTLERSDPTIAGTTSAGEVRLDPGCGVSPAETRPAARTAAAAAEVRWCTAEAPSPRPAYNGAAEAYPGIARRAWWRLFCLLWWRGTIEDPWARRMARHLARAADAQGMITGLPDVMRSYAIREHVSVQTGYTDLKRLVLRGLVRQVQAAAPGYPARYRLSAPAAVIPADLPADLARAIHGRGVPRPGPRTPRPTGTPSRARRPVDHLIRHLFHTRVPLRPPAVPARAGRAPGASSGPGGKSATRRRIRPGPCWPPARGSGEPSAAARRCPAPPSWRASRR